MKRLKRMLYIVTLFVTFGMSAVFAGPFGIEMGMSLAEIKQVCRTSPEWIQDNVYKIVPPKTHEQFQTYYVRIDADYGVYWLKAIGKDVYTNSYGEELISAFDRLVKSIEKIYGDRELYKTNELKENSIWKKDRDFMRSLLEGERRMEALWTKNGFLETLRDWTEELQIVTDLLMDSVYHDIVIGKPVSIVGLTKEQIDSIKDIDPERGTIIKLIEERKLGIKRLPDDISAIGVFLTATSTTKGYVSLEYSFSNNEKVKEKEDSVF